MNPIIIIGYSEHALVVLDIIHSMGRVVNQYCDQVEQVRNPYKLSYLGKEGEQIKELRKDDWFIAIGNNGIRRSVYNNMASKGLYKPITVIHEHSTIGYNVEIDDGVMVAPNVSINSLAKISTGVICNTGSIIEHECIIGAFAHIAPGAVLAGNVMIGEETFVGANSVIKQGIIVGNKVTIGAGSVVIRDVPDNVTIVGNPGRVIKRNS